MPPFFAVASELMSATVVADQFLCSPGPLPLPINSTLNSCHIAYHTPLDHSFHCPKQPY